MESALIIEYLFVLLMLIVLEGLLSADNALVLAVMFKHLPEDAQKKALFYGLIGAFVLRFSALFLISFLANVWQAQALGALYLIYLALKNLFFSSKENENESNSASTQTVSKKEFWLTIAKVELADIAFAVDSILAAVALAITLPETGLGHIGGMDAGQFAVVFCGGFIGLLLMRFAAMIFVNLLKKRPALEKAAFLIVGWVGIKLGLTALSHESLAILPGAFFHSALWKLIFFGVMILIALWGWFSSSPTKNLQ